MKNLQILALISSVFFLTGTLQAAEIPNVMVSVVSSEYANIANSTPELCLASNVVGSVGLYGDTHTYIRGGTMWLTASNLVNASGSNAFITFDLGTLHTLAAMKVWNYNGHASSSSTSATATNLGVQLADISYSTDGVTFTTNLENQTFDMAPGTFSAFGQTIPMGGVSARYVRIDVITNWATANAQVGLSKVRFIDDSVPPALVSATENYGSNQVTVTFSEPVDPNTATNMSNYSVQSSAGSATILSATLGEFNDRVVLQTTSLTNQTYSLAASGVYDEALTATITDNSTAAITPELILWLEADKGITTDGNENVTQWNDQSGYGHNALTNLAINQYSAPPTLAVAAVNGLPAVNFNGTQLMNIPNDANLAINGDVTICLVLDKTASALGDPISKTGGQGLPYTGTPKHGYTNNLPAPFDYQISSAQKPVWVWGNDNGGAPTTLTSSGALAINQYYIVTMVVHGTNSSWYLNGNFNGSANLPQAPADGGNPIMLGVRADSGNVSDAGAQFTGNLGEVMIFNSALSAADRTNVDNYLGEKYYPFTISQPPQSVTTNEGVTATFTVAANQGSAHFNYQWQKNSTDIPGATGAAYTTPILAPSDNGETYDVVITVPGLSTNISSAATLTVNNVAPTITSAGKPIWSQTNIVVIFSEAVDPATATIPANYTLDNGASVLSAALGDTSNEVVLATSVLNSGTTYTLTVQNVDDLFGNTISPVLVPTGIYPPATALWIKADAGVIADANGLVSEWDDQSGNGNNLANVGTSPYEPLMVTNALNGQPVIRFDGTNTYMSANSSPTLAITDDMSIFAVATFNNLSSSGSQGMIVSKTTGSQPAPYDYYVRSTAVQFYRGNGSVNALVAASRVPSTGIPHLLDVMMQGNTVTHRLDGNANGTGTLSTTIGDNGDPLYIGEREDTANYLHGDLAELIILGSSVSSNDLVSLENYLGTKYHFPVGLQSYPVITQQPVVSTNVEPNSTVTIAAAVTGNPAVTYQWYDTNNLAVPGQTNAFLVISNIQASDSYYLNATNIFGSTNSTVVAVNVVTVNTNPTNIVFSVAGNQLTLTWPADHTGWTLQAQTNSLTVGLNTNWFDVADSSSTNQIVIPINQINGSVFYRLVYP